MKQNDRIDDRPWRRVGTALCLTIAVMFFLGIYLLDPIRRPGTYLAYWAIVLFLVAWLFLLAIRDILYTRRLLQELRAKRTESFKSFMGGEDSAESGDDHGVKH